LCAFIQRARTSPSHRLVVVSIGDKNSGQQRSGGADYANGLATAGWAGADYAVDVLKYGPPAQTPKLDPRQLAGAAGVLFIGSDQSALAPALADPNFAALVRYALANAPVVLTDRAMTAAMGDWYVANPDPTATNVEGLAIAAFRAGDANVQPGLGIVPGFAFEPRLTLDQRWGRLYGLAAAHHDTIAVGVSEMTALVLDGNGATVVGQRSVVALDGRGAMFATGTNGAIAAFDVLLDTFAPGDRVAPAR
jgi:cyanophycinase-like exopeptidase